MSDNQKWLKNSGYKIALESTPAEETKKQVVRNAFLPNLRGIVYAVAASIAIIIIESLIQMHITLHFGLWIAGISIAYSAGDRTWIPSIGHHLHKFMQWISRYSTPERRVGWTAVGLIIFCNISPLVIETIGNPWLEGFTITNEYGNRLLQSSNAGVNPFGASTYLFLQETETRDLVSEDNGWITDYYYNGQLMWSRPFSGNGSSYLITRMNAFTNFTIALVYPDFIRQDFVVSQGETLYPIHLGDEPAEYDIEIQDQYKDFLTLLVIQPLYLNFWENTTLGFSEDFNSDNKITEADPNRDIFTQTFYGFGEIALYIVSPTISYNSLYIQMDGYTIQSLHPTDGENSEEYISLGSVASQIDQGDAKRYDIQLNDMFVNPLTTSNTSYNAEHVLRIAICGEYSNSQLVGEKESFEFLIVAQPDHDYDNDGLSSNDELNVFYNSVLQPDFPNSYAYYTILPEAESQDLFNSAWSYANLNIEYHDLVPSYLYIDICSNESGYMNFTLNEKPILDGLLEGIYFQYKYDGWYSLFTNIMMMPGNSYNLEFCYTTNSTLPKESLVIIANNQIIPVLEYGESKLLSDDLKDSDLDGLLDSDDNSPLAAWTIDPRKVLRLITESNQQSDVELHFQIQVPENDLYALTHNNSGVFYQWNDESVVTITPSVRFFTDVYSDYSYDAIDVDYEGKELYWNHEYQTKIAYSKLHKMSLAEFVDYWDESDFEYIEDTDGDGMPDDWEIENGLDPEDPSDAWGNPDNDGYVLNEGDFYNYLEYYAGTDPYDEDTDDDGFNDGYEIYKQPGQNPLNPVNFADADKDALSDAWEVEYGLNPNSNGDGISQYTIWPLYNPWWGKCLLPDSIDTSLDSDNDGLTNREEFVYGWTHSESTDPLDSDTDDDGLLDGEEIALQTDPLDSDSNDDGRSDLEEVLCFFEILDATQNSTTLSNFDYMEFGDSAPTDYNKDGISDASVYDGIYSVQDWFSEYVEEHINDDPYYFEEDTVRYFYEKFAENRGANGLDGQIIDLSANSKTFEGSIFIPANHISLGDSLLDLKFQLLWRITDLNIFDKIIAEYNETGDGTGENADRELTDITEFDTNTQSMKLRTRHWDYIDSAWVLSSTEYSNVNFANESLWFPSFTEIDQLLSEQDYINSYSDWAYIADGWDSQTFVDESLIGTRFGNYNNMRELANGTLLPPETKIYSHGEPRFMQMYPWENNDIATIQSIELREHEEVDYLLYATQNNIQHDLLSTVVKNPDLWDLESPTFDPEEGGIDINYIYGNPNAIKRTTQLELMEKVTEDFLNEDQFGMGWGQKTFDFDSVQFIDSSHLKIDNTFNITSTSPFVAARPWEYREKAIRLGNLYNSTNGSVKVVHNVHGTPRGFFIPYPQDLFAGEIEYAFPHEYTTGTISFDVQLIQGYMKVQLLDPSDTVSLEIVANLSTSPTWFINRPGNNLWDTGIDVSIDQFETIVISFNSTSEKAYVYIGGSLATVENYEFCPLYNNPDSIVAIKLVCSSMYAYLDNFNVPAWTQIGSLPKVLYANSISTTRDLTKAIVSNNYASTYRGEFFTFDNVDYYLHYSPETFTYNLYRVGDSQIYDTYANIPLNTTTFDFNQDWMDQSFPEYFSFNQAEQPVNPSTAVHNDMLHIHDDNSQGTTELISYFSAFMNGSIQSKIKFDTAIPSGIIFSIDVLNFSIGEYGELVVTPLDGSVQLGIVDGVFAYKVDGSQWYSTTQACTINTWYDFKFIFENDSSNTDWEVQLSIGEVGSQPIVYESATPIELNYGDALGSLSFYVNTNPVAVDDLCISTMRQVYNEFPYSCLNESGSYYLNLNNHPDPTLTITDFMNNVNYSVSPSIMLSDGWLCRNFGEINSGIVEINLGVSHQDAEVEIYPLGDGNARLININGYWHLKHAEDPSGQVVVLNNLSIPVFENENHNWRFIFGENSLFDNVAVFYDNLFLGEFDLEYGGPHTYSSVSIVAGEDQYVFIDSISINEADFTPSTDTTTDFALNGYWHDQLPDNFVLNSMQFNKTLYWTGEFAFENGTIFAYIDRFHVGHIINASWGNFDWTTEIWQGSINVPIAKYQLTNGTWVEGGRVLGVKYANSSSVNYENYFTTVIIGISGARLVEMNSTDIWINEYTGIADWFAETSIGAFDEIPEYFANSSVIVGHSGLTIKIPRIGTPNTYDVISDITLSPQLSYKVNGVPFSGNICESIYKDIPAGSIVTFKIEPDYIAKQFLTQIAEIMSSAPDYAQFEWKYGDMKTTNIFDVNQLETNITDLYSFVSSMDSYRSEVIYTVEYERDYDDISDSIIPIEYVYISAIPSCVSFDMRIVQNSTDAEIPYANSHIVMFEIMTEYATPCSLLGHIAPNAEHRLDPDTFNRTSQFRSQFIQFLTTTVISYFDYNTGTLWKWGDNDHIQTESDTLWQYQPIGNWIYKEGSSAPVISLKTLIDALIRYGLFTAQQADCKYIDEMKYFLHRINQYGIVSGNQYRNMYVSKQHSGIRKNLQGYKYLTIDGHNKGWIQPGKKGGFVDFEVYQIELAENVNELIPMFSSLMPNQGKQSASVYSARNDLRTECNILLNFKEKIDKLFLVDIGIDFNKLDFSLSPSHNFLISRHFQFDNGISLNPEKWVHHIIEPSSVISYFWQVIDPYWHDPTAVYSTYLGGKFNKITDWMQGSSLQEFTRAINTFFDETGNLIDIDQDLSSLLHDKIFSQSYELTSWDQLTPDRIKEYKVNILSKLNNGDIKADQLKKLITIGRITDRSSSTNYNCWRMMALTDPLWQSVKLDAITDADIANLWRFVSCNPIIYDMIHDNLINLDATMNIADINAPGGTRIITLRDYLDHDSFGDFLQIPVNHYSGPGGKKGLINNIKIRIKSDSSGLYHATGLLNINDNDRILMVKSNVDDIIYQLSHLESYLKTKTIDTFPDVWKKMKGGYDFYGYSSSSPIFFEGDAKEPTLNTFYYLKKFVHKELELIKEFRKRLKLDQPIPPPKGSGPTSTGGSGGSPAGKGGGSDGSSGTGGIDAGVGASKIEPGTNPQMVSKSLTTVSNGMPGSNPGGPTDRFMKEWENTLELRARVTREFIDAPDFNRIYPKVLHTEYQRVGYFDGYQYQEQVLVNTYEMQNARAIALEQEYKAACTIQVRERTGIEYFSDDWIDETLEVYRNNLDELDLGGEHFHVFDGIPTINNLQYINSLELDIKKALLAVRENEIRLDLLKKANAPQEAMIFLRSANKDLMDKIQSLNAKVGITKQTFSVKLKGMRSSYLKDFAKGIVVDVLMFMFELYTISTIHQGRGMTNDEAVNSYIASTLFFIADIGLEALAALKAFAAISKAFHVIGAVAGILEAIMMVVQVVWMCYLRWVTPAMSEIWSYKVFSPSKSSQKWGSYRINDVMRISETYVNLDGILLRTHFLRLSARTSNMQQNTTNIERPDWADYGFKDNNEPNVYEWHSTWDHIVPVVQNWEYVSLDVPFTRLTRNEVVTEHQMFGLDQFIGNNPPPTQFTTIIPVGAVMERTLSEFLSNMEKSAPLTNDNDFDGLTTNEEITHGTNDRMNDTDGDHLTDSEEIEEYFTNPLNEDSDGDHLTDYNETMVYFTNPNKEDSDDDGLLDNREITFGTSNSDADSDDDGLLDLYEYYRGTLGTLGDSDDDSLGDLTEIRLQYNPRKASDPLNISMQTSLQSSPIGFYQGTHSFNSLGVGTDPWYSTACYGEAYVNATYSIGEDIPVHNFVYVLNQSAIRTFSPEACMTDAWAIETYVGMGSTLNTLSLEVDITNGYYFAMRYNNASSKFEYRYNMKDWTPWTAEISQNLLANWSIWSMEWDDDLKRLTMGIDLKSDTLVDYQLVLNEANCSLLTTTFRYFDYANLAVFKSTGCGSIALDSVSVWKEYNSFFGGSMKGDLYNLIEFPQVFWDIDEAACSISFEWVALDGMEFGMYYCDSYFVDMYSKDINYMGPANYSLTIPLQKAGIWYFKPVCIFQNYYFPFGSTFDLELNAYSATFDFFNNIIGEAPTGFTTSGAATVEMGREIQAWYTSEPFGPSYYYTLINDTSVGSASSIQKNVTHLLLEEQFVEFWIKTNDSNQESKFAILNTLNAEKFSIEIRDNYFWLASGSHEYNTSVLALNNSWYHIRFTLSLSNYSELFIDSEYIDNFEISSWSDIKAIKFATSISDAQYYLGVRGIGISWYGYEAYDNWPEMAELTFKEETIGFGSSPLPAYVSSQTKLLAAGSDANFDDFILLSETVLLTNTGKVIYFAGSEPTVTATIRPWSSAELFEGKLYIMSEQPDHYGLSVYTLSNPQNPVLVGDPYQYEPDEGYNQYTSWAPYGDHFVIYRDQARNEIWVTMSVPMNYSHWGYNYSDWEYYYQYFEYPWVFYEDNDYEYELASWKVTHPEFLSQYNYTNTYSSGRGDLFNVKDLIATQNANKVNVSVFGEFYIHTETFDGMEEQKGMFGIRTIGVHWFSDMERGWVPRLDPFCYEEGTRDSSIIIENMYNSPGSVLFNADTQDNYDWNYLNFDATMVFDGNYAFITTLNPNMTRIDSQTAYVIDLYNEEVGFDVGKSNLPYSIIPDDDNHAVIGLSNQSIVAYNATNKMCIEESPMTKSNSSAPTFNGAMHQFGDYIYSMEIIQGNQSCPYYAYLERKQAGFLDDVYALESSSGLTLKEDVSNGNEYAELGKNSVAYQVVPYAQAGIIGCSFATENETVANFTLHISNFTHSEDIVVSLANNLIADGEDGIPLTSGIWNDFEAIYTSESLSVYVNDRLVLQRIASGIEIVSSISIITSDTSDPLKLDKLWYRIFDTDTDFDGLTDQDELYRYLSDPLRCDSDDDGMPDGWEVEYTLDPCSSSDKLADLDGDLLKNVFEFCNGTDPSDKDTDNDGSWDYDELCPPDPEAEPTDPLYPEDGDVDGDGILNALEQLMHVDPRSNDADGDFLSDYDELNVWYTDPFVQDSDGDEMIDGWEVEYNLDPVDPDDADGDPDNDKLCNLYEYYGEDGRISNPENRYPHLNPLVGLDFNSDDMKDDWQIFYSIANNSGSSDYDGDKLTNLAEFVGDWNGNHTWGSNPRVAYVNGTIGMSQDWATYYEIEFSISAGAMDPDLDKVTSAQEWAGRHNNSQYSSSNPRVKSENYNMSQDWASFWDIEFSANGGNLDTDLDKLRNYEEYRGKYTGFSSNNWLIPRSKTTTPFQYKGVNKNWIDDWKTYWDITGSTNITDTDGDRVLDWQEQYGIWNGDATWGLNPRNKNESYGMSKDWCTYWGITYSDAGSYLDADSDGVKNRYEYGNNTNPRSSDTDGDTLPDKYEIKWGLSPISASGSDGKDGNPDSDSLTNWQEWRFDSTNMAMNPKSANTDGDARGDYVEWVLYWQYNSGSGLKHSDSNRVSPISANNNPITWEIGDATAHTASHQNEVHGSGSYTDVGDTKGDAHGFCRSDALWVQANIETTWSGYGSYYGYNNATVRACLASVVLYYKASASVTNINMPAYNFQWEYKRNTDANWNVAYVPGCDGALSSGEKNYFFDTSNTLSVQYFRDNAVYVSNVGYKVSVTWYWGALGGVENDYVHITYSF